MKALFSGFGRKGAAHSPAGASTKEGPSPSPPSHADQPRTPLRHSQANNHISEKPVHIVATQSRGGDIGAAPAPTSSAWRTDSREGGQGGHGGANGATTAGGSSSNGVGSGSDWSSRLAGTIRGSTRRRKERGKLSRDEELLPPHEVHAIGEPGNRHPPSSYRNPSTPRRDSARSDPYEEAFVKSAAQIEPPLPSPTAAKPPSRSSSFRRKMSAGPRAHNEPSSSTLTLRTLKYPPSSSRSPARPMSAQSDARTSNASFDGSNQSGSAQHRLGERNVFGFGSAESNGHSSPSSAPAATAPPPPPPPMTSEELANKLNELAVSNADGLLSDDEYRTLRAGLFEKMMQLNQESMQVPQEPNVGGLGAMAASIGSRVEAGHAGADPAAEARSVVSQHREDGRAPTHASLKASSSRNSTLGNVSSFFRRGGQPVQKQLSGDSLLGSPTKGFEDRRTVYNSAPSLLSSGDGHSARPSSFHTHYSNPARSSRASTLSRFRAGSQSKRLQAEVMAADMERSYSAARSARSLRAQSTHDAPLAATASTRSGPGKFGSSGTLPASVSSSGKLAGSHDSEGSTTAADLFGVDYAEKSSAEIRAEIAVVQAEGSRLLDTFDGLEQTVIGKYRIDYAVLKRAVDEVKGEAGGGGHHPPLGGGPGRVPPSSYRPPRASSLSRRSSAPGASTGGEASVDGASLSASRHQFGAAMTSSLSADDADGGAAAVDHEVEALKAELREVLEKRDRVLMRYEERTSFLRSKLRSATIREGLLR
ncbi:uncharacterized protein PFL1_04568 [Pseudozyma flocculosa PF-1]|uniref:Uncharacterized protein n=2 Tax=Pseudozyma flocculosa TaxID=84751 RepID=A0A5C3FCB9_9BASI|nr:uncharacterized protein PFL1_04568 [Pseudozyma flocculosa PF-1]EPQ27823.1 hypothetical protein PFL1_04568 [Pseudozyma flocculosa PF-1]SPO41049.1 uncharacterized protein PSFLO_06531 [Pseudozyma flocculosa]